VNSYERVMTALKREQPDRVPIVEWAISRKVIKALCPAAEDQTDIEEMLDLDGVYKPTPEEIDHPIRGPIRTMDDLRNYVPPDPDAPQRLGKLPGGGGGNRGRELEA